VSTLDANLAEALWSARAIRTSLDPTARPWPRSSVARAEAVVGIATNGSRRFAVACVAIVDSRFADREDPPFGIIADLAVQGRMPLEPVIDLTAGVTPDVQVSIWHDGELVALGARSGRDTESRGCHRSLSSLTHLATGAMAPLMACGAGRWIFDLRPLTTVGVTVA